MIAFEKRVLLSRLNDKCSLEKPCHYNFGYVFLQIKLTLQTGHLRVPAFMLSGSLFWKLSLSVLRSFQHSVMG